MQPHEAEDLLTKNQTYINAIQRASVSLYHLGFTDLRLRSGGTEDAPLKAVVPKDDQVEFLDNIDRGLKFMAFTHSKRASRKGRSTKPQSSNSRRGKGGDNKPITLDQAKEIFGTGKTKKVVPFRDGIAPAYTKPVNRIIEFDKREREKEAERRKLEERLHAWVSQPDIVIDGRKYAYNPMTGKLMPEEEVRQCMEEVKEKLAKPSSPPHSPRIRSNAPFNAAILEKTSRYVTMLRKQIEDERSSRRLPAIPHNLLGWPKSLLQTFPEYSLMEPGDVMLTIEHCHHCADHAAHTFHEEDKYMEQATLVIEVLKRSCSYFAVRLFVNMKPVVFPSPLKLSLGRSNSQGSGGSGAKGVDTSIFRIGAFEVQFAMRLPSHSTYSAHILHSKLYTGQWPKLALVERHVLELLRQSQLARLKPLPPELEKLLGNGLEDEGEGVQALQALSPKRRTKKKKKNGMDRPATPTNEVTTRPSGLEPALFDQRVAMEMAQPEETKVEEDVARSPNAKPAPSLPPMGKRVTGTLHLATAAAEKHRQTVAFAQASAPNLRSLERVHDDQEEDEDEEAEAEEEETAAKGRTSRPPSIIPPMPSTPHGNESAGPYTPFTPTTPVAASLSGELSHDSLGHAFKSLPSLVTVGSTMQETRSLDAAQAQEARKTVLLLQQMLAKDAEEGLARQSLDCGEGDEDFWKRLELSQESVQQASQEEEEEVAEVEEDISGPS